MATQTTHTHRQTKEKTANRRGQTSLRKQRESALAWPWGLCCPAFIKPRYALYMLLPDRTALEINKNVEDICVHQVQEEHGERWCKGTTLLIINRTNWSNQSWPPLPKQGNTCMIIAKDSPNCVWRVSGTARLEPAAHKQSGRVSLFRGSTRACQNLTAVIKQTQRGDNKGEGEKKENELMFHLQRSAGSPAHCWKNERKTGEREIGRAHV